MGGLTVSAEDRFSRLNAYEYGMNPAGLLGLRDTSWAEQGSEYQSFQDGYYGENHSAISRKSGLRGAVQRERWALGLDFIYAAVNASRHDLIGTPDNSRFIRDFDIPFATSFLRARRLSRRRADLRPPPLLVDHAGRTVRLP
jgi:hypothetical protein